MKEINHLLIVSHVVHYDHDGLLHAYGPYAREIDIWADLFSKITIAAPLRTGPPPFDCLPFTRRNIAITPQLERGGSIWWKKLHQIISVPALVYSLSRAMYKADAIQIRCPENLGLLGVMLAPLFSRYRVSKYAGQWNGYEGEAWSYRLQRHILKSNWWKAPVLVYGDWPGQPAHIIPLFTSILEDHHITLARQSARNRQFHRPPRFLFVGRLTREKNVHVLLRTLHILQKDGVEFECRIIGTGPMYKQLEQQVISMDMLPSEVLIGALPFEDVLEQYTWADTLVLASETEGWPKAIAEAMAFGLVCIGSNRGLVPWMLANDRGLLVEPGDENDLASVLRQIVGGKIDLVKISRNAATWSQQFSLDGLREAIRDTLLREWQLQDRGLRRIA